MEKYASKFRNLESEQEHKNFIFVDEVGFTVVSRPKRESQGREHLPMLLLMQQKAEIFLWLLQ